MSYLDAKYINLISSRLRNYKRKNSTLYNFSCPVCNDSHTNKHKARGYIYEKDGNYVMHCHNCSVTMSFSKFLKFIDQSLYNEYLLEKLKDNKSLKQQDLESFVKKMKKPVFLQDGILKGLKKVSQLSPNNKCKQLIDSRMIPTKYHSKLFYCPNFKQYCNSIREDAFQSTEYDETRLLIPYINKDNVVHCMNFRSLGKSDLKYVKFMVNDSIPNLYGLDTVDFTKTVYCLEGEFDSMFIDNAIATGGGDLISALYSYDKNNIVIVYDNEKRSNETKKKLDKAINLGYNCVIWPKNFPYKDVNDAIIAGMTSDQVNQIINDNVYSGLQAKVKLSEWSKM